jgi:hypothetical protein
MLFSSKFWRERGEEQNYFWMNLASRLYSLFMIGFLNHYTSFTKATTINQGCHIPSPPSYSSRSAPHTPPFSMMRLARVVAGSAGARRHNRVHMHVAAFQPLLKVPQTQHINLHPLTLLAKWDCNTWLVIWNNHTFASAKVYWISWPEQEKGKLKSQSALWSNLWFQCFISDVT